MVKYYIQNLPIFLKYADESKTPLVKVVDKNVVELSSIEDSKALISIIRRCDFANDRKIVAYLKDNLPELSKEFKKLPIDPEEFKKAMKSVFLELPDEVFEHSDIVDILKYTINFILQKNEISFLIINIQNKKLMYDDTYRYKRIYGSYYRMIKLNHDLDIYYLFLKNTHIVLEKLIYKSFLFSDEPIDKNELKHMSYAININGKNLTDFRYLLQQLENNMKAEMSFIKRAKIPVPRGYFEEFRQLKTQVSEKLVSANSDLDSMVERKKLIQKRINSKEGLFTDKDRKMLFWEIIKRGLNHIL